MNNIYNFRCLLCGIIALFILNVHALQAQTATVTGNMTACYSTTATETYTTESGQSNYQWSISGGSSGTDYSIIGGTTSGTMNVIWKKAGNYTVRVSYANAAPGTLTVTVNPSQVPTISFVPDHTTVCLNGNVNFTVTRTDPGYVEGTPWNIEATVDYQYISQSGITSSSTVLSPQIYGTGNIIYNSVIVSTDNCRYQTSINGTLTGLPIPTVNASFPNYTICSGGSTRAYSFSGNATTFEWSVISNPGNITGLPAIDQAQTGNFGVYVLNNTTTKPQTAVIRVRPVFVQNDVKCYGNPITSTITVNPAPTPVTNLPASYAICNNTQTHNINFASAASNRFKWQVTSNPGNVTGIPSGLQTGAFGAYTVNNPATTSQTVTISVTPIYAGGGVECPGTVQTFSFIVNPTPVLTSTFTDNNICSGNQNGIYLFEGNAATTGYQWQANIPAGITSDIPTGLQTGQFGRYTYTNTTNQSLTVNVKVTPVHTSNGITCLGASKSFNIKVNPAPTITLTSAAGTDAQITCVNTPITNITYTLAGGATGATVTGLNPAISASVNAGVLTISGSPKNIIVAPYTITTTGQDASCPAATQTGLITVNPIPGITVQDVPICAGSAANLENSISDPAGASMYFYSDAAGTNVVLGHNHIEGITSNTTYYAKLVYDRSPSGCSSVVKPFNVIVNPVPTITVQDLSLCDGLNADLTTAVTAHSNGSTLNFFTDPTGTTPVQNPSAVFVSGTTTYYVRAVDNQTACPSQLASFQVNGLPQPSITLESGSDPQVICPGNAIANLTYRLGGSATGVDIFDLPSGLTQNVSNGLLTISGSIPTEGTYTLKINTTGQDQTCSPATASPTIFANAAPAAAFTYTPDFTNSNLITFTDQSTVAQGDIISWSWDFDDGQTSTDQNPPQHTYSGTLGNSYTVSLTVTAQDEHSTVTCSNTITQAVVISPTINVNFDVDPSTPVCLNQSTGNSFTFINNTKLNNASDSTFIWDFGDGTPLLNVGDSRANQTHTYTNPGAYTVTLTVTAGSTVPGAGATQSGQKVVVVNSLPTVTVQDIAICEGTTANLLSAVGAVSRATAYFYSDAAGNNPVTGYQNVSVPSPGADYYVKLRYDITGCESALEKIHVTVNPLPEQILKDPAQITVCAGANANLTEIIQSYSGGDPKYFSDNQATLPVQSPQATAVSLPTTFWVKTVNATTGCASPLATFGVVPTPLPIASFQNIDICNGSSADLTTAITNVTGINVDTLFFSDAAGSVAVTDPKSVAGINVSTPFYFKLKNDDTYQCESKLYSFNVSVNPVPTVTVENNISICEGADADLTKAVTAVSNNASLTFFRDNLRNDTIKAPTVVGGITSQTEFYAQASTVYCESTITPFMVSINQLPTFTVTPPAPVCTGESFELTSSISNLNPVNSTVAYFNDAFASDELTSTLVTPAVATTYYAQSTDNGTQCKSIIQGITVTLNPLPTFTVSQPAAVCAGDQVDLTTAIGNISANSTVKYYSDRKVTTELTTTTVNPLVSVTYYVQSSENTTGCLSVVDSIMVTANPLPDFIVTDPAAICAGFEIDLTTAISDTTANSSVYYYTDAAATIPADKYIVSPAITTVYYARSEENTTGCLSSIKPITITVNPLPTFTVTQPAAICAGTTMDIAATVSNTSPGSTVKYYSDAFATTELSLTTVTPLISTTYYIRSVNDNTNCLSKILAVNVTVNQLPRVAITGGLTVCERGTLQMAGAPANGIWESLSPGIATVNTTGLVNAISNGTAEIRYTVTNASGCTDNTSVTITVNALPAIGTITGDNTICAGSDTQLSNATTGGTWETSNPGVATINSSGLLSGLSGGNIDVYYITTNGSGCMDTAKFALTVLPKPSVAFTYVPKSNDPTNIQFTDQSTISSGSLSSWNWDFGDNNSSTEQHPLHSFAVSQNYNVKLVVTADNACKDSLTKTIHPSALVHAGFTIGQAQQCLTDNSFTFTDASQTLGQTNITYSWDFGDGSKNTNQNTTHSYTQPGTYKVKLVVTILPGPLKDSITYPVTVFPLPTVNISNNTDICEGATNQLTGTPANGIWKSLIPGLATIDASGLVTGIAGGTATIRYIATSVNGCIDSTDVSMTINPLPAIGEITGANVVCEGSTIQFEDRTTDGFWISSETRVANIDRTSGLITGMASGTTDIFYVVTNDLGCSGYAIKDVLVNPKPNIGFSYATDTGSPTTVQFTDQSSIALGSIISQNWDFGTGASSTEKNPTYNYPTPGYYNVQLKEISNLGCMDSLIQTIHTNTSLTGSFDVDNDQQCLSGNTFNFESTSLIVGAIDTTYLWNFGDGITATGKDVSHSYTSPGIYDVKMTVSINSGTISNTITQTVIVFPIYIDIIGNQDLCIGSDYQLSGIPADGEWSSSDPSVAIFDSSVPGLLKALASGTTEIKYIFAKAVGGCVNNASKTFTVHTLPEVTFTSDSEEVLCENAEIDFTVTRTDTNPATDWSFVYTDGNNNTTVNAQANISTFTENITHIGTTTFSLVSATDNLTGCSVSTLPSPIPVTINSSGDIPVVTPNSAVVCEEETLILTSSIIDNTRQYQWYHDNQPIDGATSSVYQVPSTSGQDAGFYYVALSGGCDVESEPVSIEVRSSKLLVQKWDDVILVDNSSRQFVAYQWYRDGAIIIGATEQAYRELGGLNGKYSAEITLTDGTKIFTCEYTPVPRPKNANWELKIYPNPSTKGQLLHITLQMDQVAYVGSLELEIYTSNGAKILKKTYGGGDITLETTKMDPGIYIVQVITETGIICSERIVVD
ncbi:MAG: PKD domain-containing protein [Bacteroidales bacterium]|nr:PKD domain-containing protein [Bacteroidales bacterium]